MKTLGALSVVLAAFLFIKAYGSYLSRAEREGEGFLSLLRFLENRLSRCPEPYSSMLSDFSEESIAELGLVEALKNGESPESAYLRAEKESVTSERVKAVMRNYFCYTGSGYLEGELKGLKRCIDDLNEALDAERVERAKRLKLFSAVSIALALGAVVMMM